METEKLCEGGGGGVHGGGNLGSGGLRARTEWTQCSRIGEINK